jgi:hypothetical protein
MIGIAGTTQSLEVKLAGAATTTELPITAAFVDISQTTLALVGAPTFQGITTGATAVVLSAAPGANVERRVNALTVVNVDTATATVTVQIDVSGTKRIAIKVILSVGDQLVVTNAGLDVLDSAGNKKQTVGLSAFGDPITVAHGGTGLATLTSRGVLVGAGTSVVAPTAAGAVSTLLRGMGGSADPVFAAIRRVVAITSSATPTPDADVTDLYDVTALAAGATMGAPTGTPYNGQLLMFQFKDNGTARTLAWNAAYVAGGVALPTTTMLSKILTVGFMYTTANSLNKWRCIASAQEA